MQSRSKRKGKAPNGRSQRRSKQRWAPNVAHSSTLSPTRILPDEADVRLMFRKLGAVSNAGVNLGVVELKANDAYDVDPVLGSTETYGFDVYAPAYSYYRVVKYHYEITATNNSGLGTDSPVMMYVTNTNTRVSLSGTRWDLYSTQPYSQSKLLALPYASGSTHTMRGTYEVARILGSKVAETDDSYRALTTGSPTDLTWLGLAFENPTSGTGINVVYDIKLTMFVRFYGREVDLSIGSQIERLQRRLAANAEFKLRKQLEASKTASSSVKS